MAAECRRQGRTACRRRSLTSSGNDGADPLIEQVLERAAQDRNFMRALYEQAQTDELRSALIKPLAVQVGRQVEKEFEVADANQDKMLSPSELRNWYRQRYASFSEPVAEAIATRASRGTAATIEPSSDQMRKLMMQAGLPFIGFGFLDNFIMLVAGNQIEAHLGIALGLSPHNSYRARARSCCSSSPYECARLASAAATTG